MNYRHAYHAGNFADVHKHVALTAALLHLRGKDKPFVVIDTHAGAGLYDLAGQDAQRTREADAGIGALRMRPARNVALAKYLEITGAWGPARYPGSPLISAALLRPQDRLIAVEKHPREFAQLQAVLAPCTNARSILDDGFLKLPTLVPPPERRAIILIDPPYEESDELLRVSRAVAEALRRFASGVFLIWYPLKITAPVSALCGELKNAGARMLSLTLSVGRAVGDPESRLSTSGLLVINPPFGFDHDMRQAGAELVSAMQRGSGAYAALDWLSGE